MNHSSPDLVRDTLPDAAVMERLSKLCVQELTASHTYQIALTLPAVNRHLNVLSRCYASHRSGAAALAERISAFQGSPPKSGGIWSPLLPALGATSATLNEKAVIALLEEAEDHWGRAYRDELGELDLRSREFLHGRVIPAQDATHAALRDLKHLVHA